MPELNSYSEMEEIKYHVAPLKMRIEMVWWRMRVSATAFALVVPKTRIKITQENGSCRAVGKGL